MKISLLGCLLFLPITFYLWYYILAYQMHFPLLYLAAIIPTIASFHAIFSLSFYFLATNKS